MGLHAETSLVCRQCGHTALAAPGNLPKCPEDDLYLVAEKDSLRAPEDGILGTEIADKYPVIGLIGAGGMGAVYKAIQRSVGRLVAIKVIRSGERGDGRRGRRRPSPRGRGGHHLVEQ